MDSSKKLSDAMIEASKGLTSHGPWAMAGRPVLPDTTRRSDFLEAVDEELASAREKFPGEEGAYTNADWLAVLTEEVGECARELNEIREGKKTHSRGEQDLRAELVQVAAMAMRWHIATTGFRKYDPTEVPFA